MKPLFPTKEVAYNETTARKYVAAQLETIRLARGMSQPKFAKLIGTTTARLDLMERSQLDLTLPALFRIAYRLDLDLFVGFMDRGDFVANTIDLVKD